VAICSYLVIPVTGAADSLAARLAALPGCDVARAVNRDVLVLVTDTATAGEESALRDALARMDGIRTLVLTFGAVDPDSPVPRRSPRRERRRAELPVLEPADVRAIQDAAPSHGPCEP
jgi:nitrate reductase NapAB chaperone NapD